VKNPTRTLKLLNIAHGVAVVSAGSAAALTFTIGADLDFSKPVTLADLVALGVALAVGYLVAAVVEVLAGKVLRPYMTRLEDQADAEQLAANQVPSESIAVAVSMQTFLADLRDGLPLAVEMAGPKGEMPQDGAEWIAYPNHPYRLEALTEWHTQRAA
jgi:hypothetical protein